MRISITFAIVLIALSSSSFAAKINSENDVVALVESIKEQMKDLESSITKVKPDEKLHWQLEIFEKWYQDPQKKCTNDIDYVFHDWTPIQRRMDGSVDFNRNWSDYRQGFGIAHNGEFFIGLDKLHELTSAEPHELLILLGDHEGKVAYALYDKFVVAGEDDKFTLKELDGYRGTAGDDSLMHHRGYKFSTFDEDNDTSKRNCARALQGGWWYNKCFDSYTFALAFLNAPYVDNELKGASSKGIVWEGWRGSDYSLKYTQMLIRPKQ